MALEIITNNGYKYIRIVENKYVVVNGSPSCRKKKNGYIIKKRGIQSTIS